MRDKKKPRGVVRPATKTEAHSRALKAMQERNQALRDLDAVQQDARLVGARLMEYGIVLAALTKREGRIRLSAEEIEAITPDAGELRIMPQKDGKLVLEYVAYEEGKPAPGASIEALFKHGFTVVEQPEPEQRG